MSTDATSTDATSTDAKSNQPQPQFVSSENLRNDPDVTTIVHLMRHGEVHNPEKILYGRLPNFRLSGTGQEQARTVAQAFKGHDITALFSSPLQRAKETITPLALATGLEVTINDQLIEADNSFEGMQVKSRLKEPKIWPRLRDPFTPSWGEPYLEIAHRMMGAVYQAHDAAYGHEAVCVSHQLPVYTTRRFLEGQRLWHDPRSRQCSLASITSLVFAGSTIVDIIYSEPAGASDPGVTGA